MARTFALLFFVLIVAGLGPAASFGQSAVADEIKRKIDDRNNAIRALETEIAAYQRELSQVAGQKKTLEGAIKELDLSRKSLSAQVAATQEKIARTNLRLEELGADIGETEGRIGGQTQALGSALREIAQEGDRSIVEYFLAGESINSFVEKTDQLTSFHGALQGHIADLGTTKTVLVRDQQEVAREKAALDEYRSSLTREKRALDVTRGEQAKLLSQTQQSETKYQQLIAEKVRARQQFESDLNQLARELEYAVDPTKLPKVGSGVLRWPMTGGFLDGCRQRQGVLKNPYCITQYFGNTPFSTKNPQIYNGGGHNAVDFGMPTGTAVLAASSGTVRDTGNTDEVRGCYSYGKWVLIDHTNGLSTLYAHLSSPEVRAGQTVAAGDTIGYSGNTGYSTGPHLHFAVFAKDGVRVIRLGEVRSGSACAQAKLPVASLEAYLNPLSYL